MINNIFNKKDLNILIAVSTILTLGSSIIWTGLPVYVAKITNDNTHIAMLFIAETIGSLLLTLLGGYFADKISKKKIAMFCFFTNSVLLFILWYNLSPENIEIIYVIAVIEACVNSLGLISLGTWFNTVAEDVGDLESNIGKKGFFTSGAKLIGMSMGPLVFLIFTENAILYSSFAYLLAFIIIPFAKKPLVIVSEEKKKIIKEVGEGFTQLFSQKKFHHLLIISIITGIFTFPLINISLYTLNTHYNSPEYLITAFWIVGSVGSLIGNILLSKKIYKLIPISKLFILANIIMGIGIIFMSFSFNAYMFIGFFALYTITNPIINNLIISELYRRMDKEYQGRITAADYVLSDIVTISVLLLFNFFATSLPLPVILLIGIPLIVIRTVIGYKVFNTDKVSSNMIFLEK